MKLQDSESLRVAQVTDEKIDTKKNDATDLNAENVVIRKDLAEIYKRLDDLEKSKVRSLNLKFDLRN